MTDNRAGSGFPKHPFPVSDAIHGDSWNGSDTVYQTTRAAAFLRTRLQAQNPRFHTPNPSRSPSVSKSSPVFLHWFPLLGAECEGKLNRVNEQSCMPMGIHGLVSSFRS